MRVLHCPSCGSDAIDKSSFSAEYMSSTKYSCEGCNWSYKNGSGMGTGSGNSGVHPRDAGPSSGQGTLTETGQWCSTCDTCAKPGLCHCLGEDQTGFCQECANYSEHDADEMYEVATYFGRYSSHDGWMCSICQENKAELKLL